MASLTVGPGKMIDPTAIAHIWISPRKRALQTFDTLFGSEIFSVPKDLVTVTEDIAEWDYGEYEGLKVGEIRQRRNEAGLDTEKPWDIWRDGCPGGE
jgi:probable phosphoglycerate mutase